MENSCRNPIVNSWGNSERISHRNPDKNFEEKPRLKPPKKILDESLGKFWDKLPKEYYDGFVDRVPKLFGGKEIQILHEEVVKIIEAISKGIILESP